MMKKVLSAVCVSAVLCVSVSACGDGDSETRETRQACKSVFQAVVKDNHDTQKALADQTEFPLLYAHTLEAVTTVADNTSVNLGVRAAARKAEYAIERARKDPKASTNDIVEFGRACEAAGIRDYDQP